jgi:hypothetical protein
MRRVALATLAHDWLRTVMLIVGLGAAWALITVQLGLRRGFEASSRAIVDHVGGDVWVGARGARVVDDGEPVVLSTLGAMEACVTRRRPAIVDYAQARRPDGSLVTVQIVGVDEASRSSVPWGLAAGQRTSLAEQGAAAIDVADAEKLGLAGDGMDRALELRTGQKLHVVAVTRGARSFTQTPLVFVDVQTARAVLSLPDDTATFWVHDTAGPSCHDRLVASLGGRFATSTREELAEGTAAHWIGGSGIGALLAAGSLMAALVGSAALLQSTVTIVRTYQRELATIRALGARRSELAAFLGWQVGAVSVLATLLALVVASAVSNGLRSSGLVVVVDGWSGLGGLGVAVASTALAAVVGGRVLSAIDPRKVLE